MKRLTAALTFTILSAGIVHAQLWRELRKKAQDQITKPSSASTAQRSRKTTDSEPSDSQTASGAGEARRGDRYYFCIGTVKSRNSIYFSNIFPGDGSAPAIAQRQFGQYLADKLNTPVSSGCGEVQLTKEAAIQRRQYYIDNAPKSMGPSEKVFEEDWTFRGRPTFAESQAATNQTMKTDGKIYPSGSGGQAAADAAAQATVRATPEYKAFIEAEPKNVVSICERNEMMNSFYNCACTADMVSRERQRVGGTVGTGPGGRVSGLHPTTDDLIQSADLRKCLQPEGVRQYVFKRATDSQRPPDSEISSCTADSFLGAYQSNPSINIRAVDMLFANSFSACNTGRR